VIKAVPFLFILTTGLLTPGMQLRAIAQVTSDGTTNTTVNPNANNFIILNGSDPNQQVMNDVYDGLRLRTWDDVRDLSVYREKGEVITQTPSSPDVLIQATSWHRNDKGKIELVASKSSAQVQPALTCAAVKRS
jgi:large exoprotein involved in heme utilization and adhesion